jgi:hypothetical protein
LGERLMKFHKERQESLHLKGGLRFIQSNDGFQVAFDAQDNLKEIDSEIVVAFCGLVGTATSTYTNNRNLADIPTISEWVLLIWLGL